MSRPKPKSAPTALIASAERVNLPKVSTVTRSLPRQQAWQSDAWAYYDTIGELRFVATWVGNVMSRAVLRVARKASGESTYTQVTDGPAVEALDSYFGGQQGQQQMLTATGVHLSVPGEAMHVLHDDTWYVVGTTEFRAHSGRFAAKIGSTDEWVPLDIKKDGGGKDMAIRVWTPHPNRIYEADSPVRANMTSLAEIQRSSQHIDASLMSRLAGAGVLFVPSEIDFPVPEDAPPEASRADVFMQALGEAMTQAITDRDSASAVVPIVVMAAGEHLKDIVHKTFWSDLSEQARDFRDSAIRRLSLGMDVPPEILTGMAQINHWSAWLIDEASVKAHIEPRLAVVANAITTAYLRPAITGLDGIEPDEYVVYADTSEIRLRPNRSKEAIELFDRLELSGDAMRRETGFEPGDKPGDEERQRMLLTKIASASAVDPSTVVQAARVLGIELPDPVPTGQGRGGLETDRSLEDHPRRDPPALTSSARTYAEALTVAGHALVLRALERVGHKLTNKDRVPLDCPPHLAYLNRDIERRSIPMLLEGAWSTLPEVFEALHIADTSLLQVLLDSYVTMLLTEKVEHTPENLAPIMETIVLSARGA